MKCDRTGVTKTSSVTIDETQNRNQVGSGAGSSPLFISKSRAALASAAKNSDAAASPKITIQWGCFFVILFVIVFWWTVIAWMVKL